MTTPVEAATSATGSSGGAPATQIRPIVTKAVPSIDSPPAKPMVPSPLSNKPFPPSIPTYAKTGIADIDAKLQEAARKPLRKHQIILGIPLDFGLRSASAKASGDGQKIITMIGMGWYSLTQILGFVLAGYKVLAYEENRAKAGMGQIGFASKDSFFAFNHAAYEGLLMPRFTAQQLSALPTTMRALIEKIEELAKHSAVMKKRDVAEAIRVESGRPDLKQAKYEALPQEKKLSKFELNAAKAEILEFLQKEGLLEVVYKKMTIEQASEILESGRPLFAAMGDQVNLQKVHMAHLAERPGFVKELLVADPEKDIVDPDTEFAIAKVNRLADEALDWARSNPVFLNDLPGGTRLSNVQMGTPAFMIPEERLPHLAMVGGGHAARSAMVNLLDRVRPDLLKVTWVHPPPAPYVSPMDYGKSLAKARENMNYRVIVGYVSRLNRSKNRSLIESVCVIAHGGESASETMKADLLVHTRDEFFGGQPDDVKQLRSAEQSLTKELDEPTDNGFSRFRLLIDTRDHCDIINRITEMMVLSLKGDKQLIDAIGGLVKRQSAEEELVIVVTGSNLMTDSVTILASSLGYRGSFIQIAPPAPKQYRPEDAEFDARRTDVRIWNEVTGRSIREGTEYENPNFSLGVAKESGERQVVAPIDVLVNGAGKIAMNPLMEAMMERDYMGTQKAGGDTTFYSKHPLFGGAKGHFQKESQEDAEKEFPDLRLFPEADKRSSSMPRWEWAYEFARSISRLATEEKGGT